MGDSTKILSKNTSDYVLQHVNQNRLINIYDGLTFGRTEGNELFSNDPLVSKTHCKIYVQGTHIFVEDVGSSNKTKVNGKNISSNVRISLSVGDKLEIGNQQLILQKKGQNSILYATPSTHSQPSESFGDAFKSFFDLKEIRYSTRIISTIGIGIAISLFKNINESQCKWGVTPYGTSTFMHDVALKCVLVGTFFSFLNHLLGRKFKTWSWQTILLGMGGASLVFGITIVTPGVRIVTEATANKLACSCMASDPTKVLEACSKWMNGKNLVANKMQLMAFQTLPKETQNAITQNLTPYLNQASQTPTVPGLSQLSINHTTQEGTVQPSNQMGADQNGVINQTSQISKLSPEQTAFIENQHSIAFELFRTRQYDKAILEIRKIFTLVNDYKDSREIERYALENQKRLDQMKNNQLNTGTQATQPNP